MKVGDYVRTKHGVISKITAILPDLSVDCDRDVFDYLIDDELDMMEIPWEYKDDYIIKSSPNIIDLIEVGDYVNGFCVLHKENDYVRICAIAIPFDLKNNEIKSIVTKEQFKEMEYRTGDDE